jgi:MFS family permease
VGQNSLNNKLSQRLPMHWVTVGAILFGLTAIWGSTYNSYSLFMTPIQESLQATRAEIVLGVTVKGAGSIFGTYLCALLLRHIPVMKLIRLNSLLLVANIISLSYIQNLIQYYTVLFIQTALLSVGGYIPLSIVIHNWFQKRSSFAIGIAFTGSGLGGAIFNWLGGIWIPALGWRYTMFLFGLITLAVSFLTLFLIVRPTPYELGLKPYGATEGAQENEEQLRTEGVEVKDAVRTASFWIFILAIFLMSLSNDTLFSNLPPHLIDEGYQLTEAAKISSAIMIFLTVGKSLMGYLYDVLGLKITSILSSLCTIVGLFSAIMISNKVFAVPLAVSTGLGLAFSSVAFSILVRSMYGPKNYARFSSYLQITYGIATIIAPVIISFIYNKTHSYVFAFWLLLISTVLAAVALFFIFPKKGQSPY